MGIDQSYAFPRLNLVGRKIRPLLVSRYWLPAVILLCILLYLPAIVSGFFADDNWHRLEHDPGAIQKLGIPEEILRKGPLDLYAFSGTDPARAEALRDKGLYPWWTSESVRINFWRPLSSLTLALDYTLWPGAPLLMHIHSLLWFVLLVILAFRLYGSIFASSAMTGLAVLLFALDDVHAGVGWISSRHALVSMVFGLLCLLFYVQGNLRRDRLRLVGSYLAFIAALFASEMGLVTFAYVLAYALFLDKRNLRSRMKQLLPFVLIIVLWRILYTALGYGVAGSILYIDPVRYPLEYLQALLVRVPLLVFSAIGLPVADMVFLSSPQGLTLISAVAAVLTGLMVLLAYPLLKEDRVAAFWGAGLLFSIVPLCAGLPRNTILGFASLGVMGLASMAFVRISTAPRSAFPSLLRRITLRVLVPILLFIYLVVGPLYALVLPATFEAGKEQQNTVAAFGESPELRDQHLILVNPASVSTLEAGLMARLFAGQPFPAYLRHLTSRESPIEIHRVDERTLIVTPGEGYAVPPGAIADAETGQSLHFHPDNISRWTDTFYNDPRSPWAIGQQVALTGVTITVSRVTPDGRIAQAVFLFERPLEDPGYEWLWWDRESQSYGLFKLPQVGETRQY